MTDLTVTNGDLRLAASVYGHPDRPAVLMIHGLSGCRDTWAEAVDKLVDRYQVWTLDLRGHGHSDRAASYLIVDYVADAEAMLDVIGKPVVVVGHSLGAVTAAALAQGPHPQVRAALLEDPPWYLGEPAEWDKGLYKVIFPMIRDQQIQMQAADAPLEEWVRVSTEAPSPMGGTAGDHIQARHLLSSASARQRHDPAAWDTAINGEVFLALRPDDPIRVPATILQADPELGPAFMAEHEDRLHQTSPDVRVIRYEGASHLIHAGIAHADRFLDDLDEFVSTHAG